jgi:hypothetical protein
MRTPDYSGRRLRRPGRAPGGCRPAGLLRPVLHAQQVRETEDKVRIRSSVSESRGVPETIFAPGVELLTATRRRYQQITGRQPSAGRLMACDVHRPHRSLQHAAQFASRRRR